MWYKFFHYLGHGVRVVSSGFLVLPYKPRFMMCSVKLDENVFDDMNYFIAGYLWL